MSYKRDQRGTPMERFTSKWEAVTESGCWIWTGAAGRYGKFAITPGNACDAHRASWILHNGTIPNGMRVLHRCDVPLCVNPAHLFLGSAKENTLDMIQKGRHRFGVRYGKDHWRYIRRQDNAV